MNNSDLCQENLKLNEVDRFLGLVVGGEGTLPNLTQEKKKGKSPQSIALNRLNLRFKTSPTKYQMALQMRSSKHSKNNELFLTKTIPKIKEGTIPNPLMKGCKNPPSMRQTIRDS